MKTEKCKICGEEYFVNRKGLHWKNNPECKRQLKEEEYLNYKYVCSCGERFKSKKSLTLHRKKEHDWQDDREKYGIKCEVCGKKQLSLKSHVKKHMSIEEYESMYGRIELSEYSKEKYSKQNKVNCWGGISTRKELLKNSEYKKRQGEKLSKAILSSEKAIEARRKNMIKLNKSDEQRAKASKHLREKWREDGWNEKSHAWQEDKEKLNSALIKGFYNTDFSSSSSYEDDLINWLKSLGLGLNTNDRKLLNGKELDVLFDDFNLAIEFDGLYWHSDKFKDKFYHLNKTKSCEAKNIQLIHIFEDEWKSKRSIVQSRLKNLLGLNSRRIGARKCVIKEIDTESKNYFLDTYHIQGRDKSSVKIGAFYNNELVAAMTFGKHRIFMNKKIIDGGWELIRFATVANTYTPGLASKMLKYFERGWKPSTVESFADRRWSQGNLYKQLGFELAGETTPNYWYSKSGYVRYHRYKFRKSELKSFDNYSPDKTEFEIMDEAGWARIYDCGSYKFVKKYG